MAKRKKKDAAQPMLPTLEDEFGRMVTETAKQTGYTAAQTMDYLLRTPSVVSCLIKDQLVVPVNRLPGHIIGPADAVKPPVWLSSPGSSWFEPLRQVHSPGLVARTRTRNTSPPSQNP